MDIGEIKQKIAEDKAKTTSSYRRYPVRFLFMELSNSTQKEIMELVKSGNGELLELSDFIMKKDDGWLTKSRFMQVIKEHVSGGKDTYVVGFSEMIRFYSRKEIESTVVSLFDIENSNTMDEEASKRRIYFICFSMMDNVYKVLHNCFSRISLLDPFINSDYELSGKYRQICFVSDEYAENIKGNKITTSVEWIGLWRNSEVIDFNNPIWCCSASLYEWHQKASPDNAFQIDVVSNTKEYLEKVMKCSIDFDYVSDEDSYWKHLLKDYEENSSEGTLKAVIAKALSINPDKMATLAGKIATSDSLYEKWLIKNYVLAYAEETYLCRVLKQTYSGANKEFFINIWIQGYRITNPEMLRERIEIIKEINKYADAIVPEKDIKQEIIEGISKCINVSIAVENAQYGLDFLDLAQSNGMANDEMYSRVSTYFAKIFKPAFTGISIAEKEFLINLCANSFVDKKDVQILYPSLYSYLYGTGDGLVSGNEESKIYLREYRNSKISNSDTQYIANYYSSGCANASNLYDLYYGIDKQDVVVSEKQDENTDVYVIDGVGAEYIPLLVDLLSRNGYEVEGCSFAAAHLPSITEINKAYLTKLPLKKWIVDFDRDVIHGEFYHTTVNLRKAFDILERIIKDIVSESHGRRIIITADHGATARARWVETKKKYDYFQADHEGRCCKVPSKTGFENNEDYIVYEDEITPGETYLISLNETSLYNRPKYEDHGGATLEEIIVPVIVAVPQGMKPKTSYKVVGEKLQVSGLDKIVKFAIIPDPETVTITESDGAKQELKKNGQFYEVELHSGKEQELIVQIEDKEFNFTTVNVAKKNMEGDDGFDD